jgi:hypothetical protein
MGSDNDGGRFVRLEDALRVQRSQGQIGQACRDDAIRTPGHAAERGSALFFRRVSKAFRRGLDDPAAGDRVSSPRPRYGFASSAATRGADLL